MPFKKIFKPIAKVLDKVIPNEIKPALPYLAAFAPVFGPTSSLFGKGIMQRALLSGGANILGQLSQEGSEGDINLLSAGLGALTGAMTAPGASDYFAMRGELAGEGTGLMSKAKQFGFETLGKGSEILRPGGEIPNLFSKAGAKAATLPAATATGDVMQAQARQLEKQAAIDAALAEAEALGADADRAAAIRNAMNAYGFFTDEEIEETIASAGYKAGGRVGFRFGGIDQAIEMVEDESIKESSKMVADMPDMDLMDLIEEFEIIFKRKPMNIEELKQFYRENYEMESPVRLREKIKEKVTVEAKDGGRIGLQEGGVLRRLIAPNIADFQPFLGQPAFQPLRRAEAVFPRLNELEQGVNIAENKLTNIRNRLGNEQRQGLLAAQPAFGLQPLSMARIPLAAQLQTANRGGVDLQGMKDGGLMDLDGKEMDLRKGGFVPIGKKERADDVPARLSKNEFVMTADAVRAAGGGSVNKGAKRMYNLMNTLEARA